MFRKPPPLCAWHRRGSALRRWWLSYIVRMVRSESSKTFGFLHGSNGAFVRLLAVWKQCWIMRFRVFNIKDTKIGKSMLNDVNYATFWNVNIFFTNGICYWVCREIYTCYRCKFTVYPYECWLSKAFGGDRSSWRHCSRSHKRLLRQCHSSVPPCWWRGYNEGHRV